VSVCLAKEDAINISRSYSQVTDYCQPCACHIVSWMLLFMVQEGCRNAPMPLGSGSATGLGPWVLKFRASKFPHSQEFLRHLWPWKVHHSVFLENSFQVTLGVVRKLQCGLPSLCLPGIMTPFSSSPPCKYQLAHCSLLPFGLFRRGASPPQGCSAYLLQLSLAWMCFLKCLSLLPPSSHTCFWVTAGYDSEESELFFYYKFFVRIYLLYGGGDS
jgi:hypothetical protein